MKCEKTTPNTLHTFTFTDTRIQRKKLNNRDQISSQNMCKYPYLGSATQIIHHGNPSANMDGLFYCHQDPQLAHTQIPSQMGGWRAQQERLCRWSTSQSQCPVLLPYIGVQWRWPRGVIHLTSTLRVAAPPVARVLAGPVLLISTVI